MKTLFLRLFMVALFMAHVASAAIVVPGSNGTDGVLNITEDTEIDLSQALDGTWNQDNTANPGQGVYDASKWAVVFKYSSVTIATDATVTFKNHASRAPVVWLVSGDVTIDGTLSVNGANYSVAPALAEAGPGGFRGGTATFATGVKASAGFGPGGGSRNSSTGTGGSYGTSNGGPAAYGNPSIVPLIGGSGGAGDGEFTSHKWGGGGGGGAILIACAGTTSVNGILTANGGSGVSSTYGTDVNTGGGSGGGIRIVTHSLDGAGITRALGGGGWQVGGLGRIRLERVVNNNTLQVTPDPSMVPLTDGSTALLWPPAEAPTVKIISIGGETAPDDPLASFGTVGADVALPEVSTVQVVIETVGVEQASLVQVRLTKRSNANFTTEDAVVDTVVSTDPLVVRWTADIPVANGYAAIQAKVVRP